VSSQQAKTNPAIHGQSSQPTTPDMMRFQEKKLNDASELSNSMFSKPKKTSPRI
jgi:hypothetical protein